MEIDGVAQILIQINTQFIEAEAGTSNVSIMQRIQLIPFTIWIVSSNIILHKYNFILLQI